MYNIDIKKEKLKPIYNARQKFYKKAHFEVISEWNEMYARITKIKLYSRNALVCTIEYFNPFERMYYIHVYDSTQTATKHLKEFLLQWFYCKDKNITKKDIWEKRCKKYNVADDEFIKLPY